ncbi:MAG TPA: heme biosynthesis HemY N-terminal domain-containing protein [Roseiarcus sp.]|nr:heme biosynthesis HemY N-terminal domain-containing protein [Roseiarcus sp.]
MFRVLIFLAALALAGWGLMWLADNPGIVTLEWGGVEYRVSLMLAFGAVAALAILFSIVVGLLRFIFNAPSLVAYASRARRREKGLRALSRGMIAVGAGDAQSAARHAAEAKRLIGHEPMTKLLAAQAAHLAGDWERARAAYKAMLEHHETHGAGLRGLHLEARRAGDHEAALHYAMRANEDAPAAWAGQAVLDDRARRGDWPGALATVDLNAAARLIDRPTANRWRAVIKTAMAQEKLDRDPKGALALAQEAIRLAPTLVPAAVISGKLLAEGGDYRRATRILETAYAATPHPEISAIYTRLRRGDSTEDRLARAKTLARVAPHDPESMLAIGRAALEAHDRDLARAAIAPLLESGSPHGRPTRRVCLLRADIAEADGDEGAAREWLGRAARAPRDKAWVANGLISDRWAPASPSGELDVFVWRTPDERIAAPAEPPPVEHQPREPAPPAAPPQIAAAPAPAAEPPDLAAEPPAPAAPARAPASQTLAAETPAAQAPIPIARARAAAASRGMVMDPASMAPDDPGPQVNDGGRKDFRLYASE